MGGSLLRRKILSVRGAVLLFIALAAGFSARGNSRYAPLFAAEQTEDRPLRSSREAAYGTTGEAAREPLPPLAGNVLSPLYAAGETQTPFESVLLTGAALQNPLTQRYIRQYSSDGGLSWLSAVMEKGAPYLAFIRKEIAARNLPPELLYLPVIESGYLPQALSRAGAAGLWQFMKNSIAPHDMVVNEWIDERRDFWKSTQGALQKLTENYRYFGDWPLALAAYNAGLGAISRVTRQSGIRDYWLLSEKKLLKTETVHYVPKFLAAAYILSNPRRFGMEAQWPEDPQWKRIAVERPVDLRLLAEEAGVDSAELTSANRELLHNVTPPGQNYFLKVRAESEEKITRVLEQKDVPLMRYYFHTVRSGDTLYALALHYGITVNGILSSNPGVRANSLRIGSRLLIPALKETGPYARPAPARENLVFDGTHVVQKGETLWSIALACEVDPEVLAEANEMELTDILREGKTLKTPIKK